MGILQSIQNFKQNSKTKAKVLAHKTRVFDVPNPYPLTREQVSKNKVLMKWYKRGVDDNKRGNMRAVIKSYLFQEAYNHGYDENTD